MGRGEPSAGGGGLGWIADADSARAAARFAARVVALDTAYISHGEIQTGLADDGEHWAADIAALYEADFADLGDARELLIARGEDGKIAGIAVLSWEETSRRRFAVLEDMLVAVEGRSSGLGARMLEAVEARVRERGREWLFLESGVRNHGAHRFFERHGFGKTSEVFAKRL